MKVHESSRERRMVIITSLERAGSANVGEERIELGKTERKKEKVLKKSGNIKRPKGTPQ